MSLLWDSLESLKFLALELTLGTIGLILLWMSVKTFMLAKRVLCKKGILLFLLFSLNTKGCSALELQAQGTLHVRRLNSVGSGTHCAEPSIVEHTDYRNCFGLKYHSAKFWIRSHHSHDMTGSNYTITVTCAVGTPFLHHHPEMKLERCTGQVRGGTKISLCHPPNVIANFTLWNGTCIFTGPGRSFKIHPNSLSPKEIRGLAVPRRRSKRFVLVASFLIAAVSGSVAGLLASHWSDHDHHDPSLELGELNALDLLNHRLDVHEHLLEVLFKKMSHHENSKVCGNHTHTLTGTVSLRTRTILTSSKLNQSICKDLTLFSRAVESLLMNSKLTGIKISELNGHSRARLEEVQTQDQRILIHEAFIFYIALAAGLFLIWLALMMLNCVTPWHYHVVKNGITRCPGSHNVNPRTKSCYCGKWYGEEIVRVKCDLQRESTNTPESAPLVIGPKSSKSPSGTSSGASMAELGPGDSDRREDRANQGSE